jgi:hypothetical protein
MALCANRHTRGTFSGLYFAPSPAAALALQAPVAERPIALPPVFIMERVIAQENALSYRVSQNGSAGEWYWEVISDRKIIGRGLAPTKAQARAQALKVAASHAVRQPGEPTPPFESRGPIEAP